MKMRTCGLFWHKAVVSLKFGTPEQPQLRLLTIARSTVLGGNLKIPLSLNTAKLLSVSGKEARHYQLKIRYGSCFQTVTLRAPTSAIYETWWTAIENALARPNFLVLPVIDARDRQVMVAPVVPTQFNALRSKQVTLKTVAEEPEDDGSDIPMLEAGGPSSPTAVDILASWRTWGSLDYFASPPSVTGPLSSDSVLQDAADDDNITIKYDDNIDNVIDRISVYSDISEFWSRPSELEDKMAQEKLNPAPATNFTARESHQSPQPQDDDDIWLDEIALYAFRQKIGASRMSEQRPSRHITERMHPLLKYAIF